MRNPAWQRDELILALDAYLNKEAGTPDVKRPAITELSGVLRSMRPEVAEQDASYRSPASVVMKLMNFRSLDRRYPGRGLTAVGRLDRIVWQDFADDRALLASVASALRRSVSRGEHLQDESWDTSVPDALEGRILSRLHTLRERDSRIVALRKAAQLASHGTLACEACGFDFERTYGERGRGFIECHHVLPLSEVVGVHRTRPEHLALLCSNCHRMIHARRRWLTLPQLSQLLESGQPPLQPASHI